jgi:hypothetical protein
VGTVEQLWVKRAHRGPMDAAAEVEVVAGAGIVGNADQRGWRPVTLLSAERWARVADDLGRPVDPAVRRANVLLAGTTWSGRAAGCWRWAPTSGSRSAWRPDRAG